MIILFLPVVLTMSAENASVMSQNADLSNYKNNVEPLLKKYCYDCHGPKKAKADLRLDELNPDLINGDDAETWREVLDNINLLDMPPKKESQFSAAQKRTVVDWLSKEFDKAIEIRWKGQKHTSFRRMTKYEFANVLSDLLGVQINADDIPEEPYSKEGFQNNSSMLFHAPDLIQVYREVALNSFKKAVYPKKRPDSLWYVGSPMDLAPSKRQILSKRFDTEPKAPKYNKGAGAPIVNNKYDGLVLYFKRQKVDRKNKKLTSGGFLPKKGRVHVRFRAVKNKPGKSVIKVMFGYGSGQTHANKKIIAQINVDAAVGVPKFYDVYLDMIEMPRNPDVDKLKENPNQKIVFEDLTFGLSSGSPGSANVDHVVVQTHAYEQWPPKSHQNIFIDSENKNNEKFYAKEILANFMAKAYRRDVNATEVEKMYSLYNAIKSDSFVDSIVETLSFIVTLPQALFIIDNGSQNDDFISDNTLASRLSYFLWASRPDKELMNLASAGKLNNPSVLAAQVKRMLANKRSDRFIDQYTFQWLNLESFESVAVDRKLHRAFNDELQASIGQEPFYFFKEVLKNNMPIFTFIDSDFVVINKNLASHYGISHQFKTNSYERVDVKPESNRGGVMTQAAFLTGASDGTDSHPIKRGLWLIERILDDSPPMPPAVVAALNEDDPTFEGLTLKEKLILHREKDACIDCHKKIDPWGVVFENYSAIGAWRTSIKGRKLKAGSTIVDSSVELSDGTKVKGVKELKKYLLDKKRDKFINGFVNKMCSYALGRTMGYGDRKAMDEIVRKCKKTNYKLADLITIIVQSDIFRMK